VYHAPPGTNKSKFKSEMFEKFESKLCDPNNVSNLSFPDSSFDLCPQDCKECLQKQKKHPLFPKFEKSGLIEKWKNSIEKSQNNQTIKSVGSSFFAELNDNQLQILDETLTLQNHN
jgi:hypothetical protein